ncbi:MAG: DUF4426 domain-containing protein [Steroidobacteraceae bacterium]|jgi:hypothetical protein|nr:DUF4426 domain-containing protein [Steroidobacteraceae bacterium]
MRRRRACAALAILALAACGGPPPGPVRAPAQSDPGFVVMGGHELRYGTVPAAELTREVAAAYGIQPRAGVLVLSVSVLRREAGHLPAPVEASLRGTQRNLIGEPVALEFRELRTGGGPSWVAEISPTAPGIVLIDVEALPADGGPPLKASLKREFAAR